MSDDKTSEQLAEEIEEQTRRVEEANQEAQDAANAAGIDLESGRKKEKED